MKPTSPDRIRNVALISHGGAGKTSLAEAMLFDAGAISRLGSVEAGTSTLDSRRAEAQAEHQPGDRNARGRRRTHHARRHARLRRLPGRCGRGAGRGRRRDRGDRRLGRGRGRHRGGLAAGRGAQPAALHLRQQDGPRERELRRGARRAEGEVRAQDRAGLPADRLRRFVPRLHRRHRAARQRLRGRQAEGGADPAELEGIEHSRRDALVEAAAEASDELMEKYLEGQSFTDAEIEAAVHKGTREGSVVPVFVGSALKNIGVRELISMIAKHVPSPAEVGTRTTTDGKEIAPDPNGPFIARSSRPPPIRSSAGSPTSGSSPARSTGRATSTTSRGRRKSASATFSPSRARTPIPWRRSAPATSPPWRS